MGWVVSRRPGPPAALQGPPPRLRKAATRTRGATPSFASHGPKRIHGPAGGRPIGARDRGSPHPALSHARPRTKRCRDPRPGLKRTTRSAARQALVSRARSDAATRDPGSNARRAWPHAGISSRAHEAKTRPSTRARTHVALGSNSATRAALAAPERLARRGATRPAATDSDPAGPQCCGAAPRSQNETWPNGPTHTRRCDKQPPAAGHSASVTGTAPRRQPGGPVLKSRARPRSTPGPTARPLTVLTAIGAPSGVGVDMGRGVSMRGPGRRPDVRRAPTGRTPDYRARPRGPPAGRLRHKVPRATNPAGHRGRCGSTSLPGHRPRDFTGY